MSLTQVLIASGLLEKLVMRYASSMPSSSSLGNVSAIINSPSNSALNAVAQPSASSGDAYDAEVQKLFALCLDLADDEAGMVLSHSSRFTSTSALNAVHRGGVYSTEVLGYFRVFRNETQNQYSLRFCRENMFFAFFTKLAKNIKCETTHYKRRCVRYTEALVLRVL
jgi:hypothetical protein